MKNILILTCMLVAGIISNAKPVKSKSPIHVKSTRDNMVYFKVSKELIGATIEIYNEEGTKLTTDEVIDQRVLIDFYFGDPGKYYIKLITGSEHELVEFIKIDPAVYSALANDELISVTQGLAIF